MHDSSGYKKNRGFTLIELLVSVGIFLFITGAVLVNVRAGRQAEELRLAGEAVTQTLRRAQGMVLSGVTYMTDTGPAFPARGYAVRFGTGEESRALEIIADETIVIATEKLPAPLAIQRYVLRDAGGVEQTLSADEGLVVEFRPPSAVTTFAGFEAARSAVEATVVFRHAGTGATRRISINRISGRISVE